MPKQSNIPLTKKDLAEFTKQVLVPTVDTMIKNNLGEFTEEILLPAVERIIDDQIDEKVPKIIDEKVPKMINKAKIEIFDHIDDRIADLRGDIIIIFRKEERRFWRLTEILHKKNILDKNDIKTIEDLTLFPQIPK